MKKVFFLMLAAFAGFAFHSCEDVPAPYEVNDEQEETGPKNVFFDETFTTSLGDFSAINTVGTYAWACSYSCAQVTSYADADGDGTKDNNEAESWLISPACDLTDVEAACISFEYILRYANANQMESHYRLLISSDYVPGKLTEATWTSLPYNLVQGSDWETWYSSGNVNVPAEFLGQPNVTVALCYKATTKAATWEVKNFKMVRGAGDYTPGGDEPTDEVRTLPYTESFATSLGGFKNYTTSGAGEWIIDYSTAKATGYDNSSKLTTAGTYYLVSPAISLEGVTEANVSYEYILRYDRGAENQQVYISADFADDATKATWVLLKGDHTEGSDWSTFSYTAIDIPAEFLGKQVRIAFRYNTNATSGSTWEVKNFAIQAGKAGSAPDAGGSEDTGDATALNGDFENWDGGKPIHWKSASTASSASLAQSTDAHGGTYSVLVKGQTKNTRLSYKELTLPAGTYTMKFYIKAANAGEVVSCRPGYAIVVDGSISGGDAYKYADYVNDITSDEWVLVEHSFTLEAETVVCPLVMNPKNPGKDFLIDDFILSDAAGTFYIK